MPIYKSVEEIIGHTPLVEIQDKPAHVLVKVEGVNPGGSIKDRVAKNMIDMAEKAGRLKPGAAIIEPTSGNTGIGLAMIGAARGYRVIMVMPDTMSVERRKLLKAYGAELVLTPGAQGMAGAIAKAEALHKEIPGSFIPSQFDNPDNPAIHEKTTGPEIWKDTDGHVDIYLAGVGTGGTLTGTGRYLKKMNPDIQIYAIEPAGSPVLAGGKPGPHMLQGIGAGFVPKNLDTSLYNGIVEVTNEDAFAAGRWLAKTQGILAGISAGANVWAALELAKKPENAGKTIVTVLPDTGDRYLSTPLFED